MFYSYVEPVKIRQSSLVKFGRYVIQHSIGGGIVEFDIAARSELVKISLCLCERESRSEIPSSVQFPLPFFAESERGNQVDVVSAVECGRVIVHRIGQAVANPPVVESDGVNGP